MTSKVAIIGFGSQGRAQAVRLRDAGAKVKVGLRAGSRSRSAAKHLGFSVTTPGRAIEGCDLVALLVPDRVGRSVLDSLSHRLDPDCAVVFAAGYPLVFPSAPKAACDLVMVAPHGPGRDLEAGGRMSGFVAVGHDKSGRAMARARQYARALGLNPLYETTPRSEALGDLFGEQTLLCGGLLGLVAAVTGVMVRKGLPLAHAYFETVSQLEQLSRLLAERGVRGFWQEISDCAAAGAAKAAPQLFGTEFERALEKVWNDVESGRFARTFQKHGRPRAYPAEWKVLERLERSLPPRKKGGRAGHPS
jgi:ketol-acid reductoisomerase